MDFLKKCGFVLFVLVVGSMCVRIGVKLNEIRILKGEVAELISQKKKLIELRKAELFQEIRNGEEKIVDLKAQIVMQRKKLALLTVFQLTSGLIYKDVIFEDPACNGGSYQKELKENRTELTVFAKEFLTPFQKDADSGKYFICER